MYNIHAYNKCGKFATLAHSQTCKISQLNREICFILSLNIAHSLYTPSYYYVIKIIKMNKCKCEPKAFYDLLISFVSHFRAIHIHVCFVRLMEILQYYLRFDNINFCFQLLIVFKFVITHNFGCGSTCARLNLL